MFCIIMLTFACTPKVTEPISQGTSVNTPTTPTTPESYSESGKNYSIKVLNPNLASPRKEMSGIIDGVNIVVNYGSPSVKGRKIQDALIPYGKVWRTGANEATTIEFSKDVNIEGKQLKAGKYGLFTLNQAESCEVIFNSVYDQWGAYKYDSEKDVLRTIVRPVMSDENAEMMDFTIAGDQVVLNWEKVRIPFEVRSR